MKILGQRFRSWLDRRGRAGRTPAGILLWELPPKLARAASRACLDAVHRRCITPLAHASYASGMREACAGSAADPYFVVLVPFTLHHAIPCVALASRHVPVVLVLNGVGDDEEQQIVRRFPDLPTLRLRTWARSVLPHGSVIEILLRHASGRLVLLDPDLFVFDPAVFTRMRLATGEIAVGAFGFENRRAGRTFPTTHLLALDAGALRALMARHRIRPVIYRSTPRRLVEPLASMGLGDDNFVKDYLPYYDPLNLLLAMALHDGHRIRVLHESAEQAFHVGGVSYLDGNAYLDYFNLRLLDLPWAAPFASRYRARLTGSLTQAEARARLAAERSQPVIDEIDRVVSRLVESVGADPRAAAAGRSGPR